jgi:hypothetical protein
MAEYAEQNGLTFIGPVYNTYLLDELSITDPEQIPIASFRVSIRGPARPREPYPPQSEIGIPLPSFQPFGTQTEGLFYAFRTTLTHKTGKD